MTTYREQLEVIDTLRIREGETRRMACPFCGGQSTFSASRSKGRLVWNCFRASCEARGRRDAEMSSATIKERLERSNETGEIVRPKSPMPRHLSSPRNHDAALQWLERNGCLDAYEQGLAQVRFAPATGRLIFLMNGGLGGVGRSLRGERPKWQSYGDTTGLLSVNNGEIAVVVEDAASACAVARLPECSGCALLGTNLSALQRRQLCAYKSVRIALDKDASRKAIALQSKLEGVIETRVTLLDDDLKYLSPGQIREILL